MVDNHPYQSSCKDIGPHNPLVLPVHFHKNENTGSHPVNEIFCRHKTGTMGKNFTQNPQHIINNQQKDSGKKGMAEHQKFVVHIRTHGFLLKQPAKQGFFLLLAVAPFLRIDHTVHPAA